MLKYSEKNYSSKFLGQQLYFRFYLIQVYSAQLPRVGFFLKFYQWPSTVFLEVVSANRS